MISDYRENVVCSTLSVRVLLCSRRRRTIYYYYVVSSLFFLPPSKRGMSLMGVNGKRDRAGDRAQSKGYNNRFQHYSRLLFYRNKSGKLRCSLVLYVLVTILQKRKSSGKSVFFFPFRSVYHLARGCALTRI